MRFCHKQPETSKALILMCNFNTYRSSSKILCTLVLIQRGGAKLRNEENNSGSFEKRRQASNNHKKHRKEIQPQILLVTKPMSSSAGIIALAPPCWQIAQIAQIAQLPTCWQIAQVPTNCTNCTGANLLKNCTGAKRWLDFRFITSQEFTWTRLKTLPSLRAPLSPSCREIRFISAKIPAYVWL